MVERRKYLWLILTVSWLWGCRGPAGLIDEAKPQLASSSSRVSKEDKKMAMDLTSPAFGDNQQIPSKYTCDGENVSPLLAIQGVPEEAVTLVLIVDDPDAPRGDWVHWMVWNINPDTEVFLEGELPDGAIEGYNDFGNTEYGGPCPPSGVHRYQFKLYALDEELDLEEDTTKDKLEKAMAGHIVDEVMLTGLYGKQ